MEKNARITISILIIFIGICVFSSNYFNTKKNEVFDDMNKLYYEQIVSLDEETVKEYDEDDIPEELVEGQTSNENEPTTKKVVSIDYTKYYVGYIRIPAINLEHGFVDKNSRYNNVNRNIYVHPSSNYPNVNKGNLILASHSGTSSISYFKKLYKLNLNDDVYIKYDGKDYHYKITKIYKDDKDGSVAIRRDYNKTTLTLITCTKGDKKTQTIYICELI